MSGAVAPDEAQVGRDPELGRRLLRYARPYTAALSAAVLLLLFEAGLALVGPALTQRALDVALPARDRAMLATLGAIYAGTLLLSFFGE